MSIIDDDNFETGFVNGIQFGIYSPEVIRSKSVVHITCETLYDSNGEPKINGLFDLRMGPIEPNVECKTCEQTYVTCPGHFGHIELPKPVFNLQFESDIVKILRCICIKCSRVLVNKNDKIIKNIIALTKGNNKERFEKIFKLSQKAHICGAIDKKNETLYDNGGCGAIQPLKYNSSNFRSDYEIVAEWKDDSEEVPINISQKLNAEIVLAIFKRITEDDAIVMGFSPKWCMPSWLLITMLPVVPPSVRPSVRQYNSQRSEDDLTNNYYSIIKWTKMLQALLVKTTFISPEQIKQYNTQIQYYVIALFNNEIKGIPPCLTRGGRPMKTLRQRLAGKEGRIRNNLMGKRVDFSARSVISADANLKIEELGVPYKIAMNLTFPEVVNKININKLYQYIRNGNKIYPGAKSIKRIKDGKQYAVQDKDTSSFVLEYGDTVNRHLINGDIVLFNRQPSLHKMSMMAHKVRVMEGNTFRLNVDVCKPYNADFDGDEMNMHVPQSIQTAVELQYLASVSKNIISPSLNEPIIGPAQDNLLGLFKLTDDNVFFSHQEFMNLLVGVEKFNGNLPEPDLNDGNLIKWTGKQLYSIILPPITYSLNLAKKKLKNVIIENGILKQGQIEKGASTHILHYIVNDYGSKEATRYLNDLQTIVSRYLIRSGFSVGISDLIVHKDTKIRNEEFILKGKKDVIELTKKVHLNILADVSDHLDLIYDGKIAGINSHTVKQITDQIIAKMPLTNRINYIVTSGSKGKDSNIQQMMCLLGQQTIDQKRVPLGFSNRSLPHYPRFEDGIESRGFISSNFMNGLNPQEYFFHAMAGREGVIDTAVKTANSGYLQRRLVKSMEDLKIAHDYTVRSSNNDIIQFCYGYDGFNSVDLEKQKTNFTKIDIAKLNNNYYIDINDKFEYVIKSELTKMKKIADWKTIITDYNKNLDSIITDFHNIYTKFNKIDEVKLYYPVNFNRLLTNTLVTFKLKDVNNKSDLHPIEIILELHKLIEYCQVGNRRSLSCELLIWDYLSPKVLIRDLKINKIAFLHIINSVKARYKNSLAEGGEMVGPIAAQSIGEQSTQMTLNTFHSAGIGSQSSVTQGVPRLNEILSNTRTLKHNSYEIYLDEDNRFSPEMAEKIGNNLDMTTIGDILDSSAIYLEPNNNFDSVLPEDREFLEIYKLFSEIDSQSVKIPDNPWLIRLEFNRRKIIDNKITMEDIQLILKEYYPNSSLMFIDDNASKLVFRIRLNFEANKANDDIIFMEQTIKNITDISIKGVYGITNVIIPQDDTKLTSIIIKENGSFVEKKEYKIITDGSKILNPQILFDILIRKGIDYNRTFSIDPNEMYSIFGIEAARFQIQYQLNKVLTDNDINISPRHLDLLCDKMCQNGDIMAVSRHGIKKENIGPLAKASFEETTDQLLEASLFGAFDNIKGVSSNIMVGQIPNCGTGDSVVLLDEDLLNTYQDIIEEEKIDIDSYFKTSEYCDGVDVKMSLNDIYTNDGEFDYYPDVGVE